MNNNEKQASNKLAKQIMIAMLFGAIVGLLFHLAPQEPWVKTYLIDGLFGNLGKLFISLIMMLVVPIVFVSLVCGVSHLNNAKQFGGLAIKTIALYLCTTALAIAIAVSLAALFHIGSSGNIPLPMGFDQIKAPSFRDNLLNIIPRNPIEAMAKGNILQVIVFAILFGLAIGFCGEPGKRIAKLFDDLNEVVMKLVMMIMKVAPYGVFCLIASLFARLGYSLIFELVGYFVTVLLVLFIQLLLVYPSILHAFTRLNPVTFLKKMYGAMVFAFSVSSSSASIPITLSTVERRLGVGKTTASFVIPLGATINMDGTAIMQGIATVFIANVYHIDIGFSGYLMVILTATLASIGTAGVPGVGLITLSLVLKQVGLPIEGIAMIIGIDRLLDMVRTSVNIAGDAMISCIVSKSEGDLNQEAFKNGR